MPAYNSDDAFAASFVALVEPWLRENVHAAAFDFAQLHFALDGLQYLLTADRSGIDRQPAPAPNTSHVKCSMHDCAITSAVPNACVLNFAPRDTPPLWFCRAHHPAVAGLPPPGYTPPRKLDPLA